MSKENGGPMFPSGAELKEINGIPFWVQPSNWTVRDEFAKAALQGLIADPWTMPKEGESADEHRAKLAQIAGIYADLMLIERKRP